MKRAFLAVAFAVLLSVPVFSATPDATSQLIHATTFCMGCEVYAGRIVSVDHAFISVLHQPDAAKQLQVIFERGTPEGKMYALAGLRQTSPDLFRHDIAQLAGARFSVVELATVEQGILRRVRVGAELKTIQDGAYRLFVSMALSHKL